MNGKILVCSNCWKLVPAVDQIVFRRMFSESQPKVLRSGVVKPGRPKVYQRLGDKIIRNLREIKEIQNAQRP